MRIFRVTSALLLIMSYIFSGCEPTSSISDVPTQAHLHHIHFVDQNNGWVGGKGQSIGDVDGDHQQGHRHCDVEDQK